ncbi:alpha-amylase family glycosyl hydrolase [Adhaeretor mobilis]|uniref:Sucrose phosphorylase n=1 Tax=Adhaeretor mobilis TaxID=1930276 RepID=A0A517MT36_9BACT|nr:alpha-amylase family glycosyl hydrolase [Adhaeretor mobilis]QDS98012.1 Sucrose phosphorylase [Adhaeretor mobilis]
MLFELQEPAWVKENTTLAPHREIAVVTETTAFTTTTKTIDPAIVSQLLQRLELLYGEAASEVLPRLIELIEKHATTALPSDAREQRRWTQEDVVLITYGDQVQHEGQSPLAAFDAFLAEQRWDELFSTVHFLPFCPYSSDDGFSVIDYLQVDPALGDWEDLGRIGSSFGLMFDLVLNHCSVKSDWFAAYLRRESPYDEFFFEAEPTDDLGQVVRPRSLPLLTEFETASGPRHVWTTFSADQVDLNYASPDVLLTMLDVLLEYAARGAQIIRLDAVAFLWKVLGTNCLHLPETHEVVKLARDVLELVAPHVWVLTETNVPHHENVSYFGDGDEAHMVYQFSLPPLLLDTFVHGDATYFNRWLAALESPRPGTTYFNFTASHDGIGVRPLEGLVPDERVDSLVAAVEQRGGRVNTRRRGDRDVPYELNITYVDALSPEGEAPESQDEQLHARRFLATQAVMLAVQGVPATYFHSLVGTRNDQEGAEESGIARRINRRKFQWDELHEQIGTAALSSTIYKGYQRLLRVRRSLPAFHPDAPQRVLEQENPALIAFERTSLDASQRILVVANSGDAITTLNLSDWNVAQAKDLVTEETLGDIANYQLPAGSAVWLEVSV